MGFKSIAMLRRGLIDRALDIKVPAEHSADSLDQGRSLSAGIAAPLFRFDFGCSGITGDSAWHYFGGRPAWRPNCKKPLTGYRTTLEM
jgi:hypothetical protein